VESIRDPKQVLGAAYGMSSGSRRLRASNLETFLEPIAERVSLSSLRQVPAFQRFEKDLAAALRDLGYVA
jgi:hypothetical protein